MCIWPKRWLKTGAETTWTPGESPRWVLHGWKCMMGYSSSGLQKSSKIKYYSLKSLTIASASLSPRHVPLLWFLCADGVIVIPFRSMRQWWRVWTGTPPRCRPRTPHRRPSRWRCGRNTSSGRRATHCVPKIRPSSPREVTYRKIHKWWAAGFDSQLQFTTLIILLFIISTY